MLKYLYISLFLIVFLGNPMVSLSSNADIKETIKLIKEAQADSETLTEADLQLKLAKSYQENGDYRKAERAFVKSIELYDQLGLMAQSMEARRQLAFAHQQKGRTKKAIIQYEKALNLALKQKQESAIRSIIKSLKSLLPKSDYPDRHVKYDQILAYLDLGESSEDLENELNQKEVELNQMTLNLDLIHQEVEQKDALIEENEADLLSLKLDSAYKAQAIDSLDRMNQINEANIKAEQANSRLMSTLIYALVLFLILAGIIIFVVIKYSKQQKAQKEIIQTQNDNIKDSIDYAQTLQQAILPADSLLDSMFDNYFVINKPRDIVSGDFYWAREVGNKVYLAVADCTGHGVPGAMVSMVCSRTLHLAVVEHGNTVPGIILDETRRLLKKTFESSKMTVKDGMDIALVVIDRSSLELEFAGAGRPLWILEKSNSEIVEIKGENQPIASYHKEEPFKTNKIQLKSGDQFYMFSDGIIDQFGGPKDKKFMRKQLKQILLDSKDEPIPVQKEIIQERLIAWQGTRNQTDDICVFGVKMS